VHGYKARNGKTRVTLGYGKGAVENMGLMEFYKGKKVLLTGHTGFKGSWMSVMLVNHGAEVIGYSSCSKTEIRLFDLCGVEDQIKHIKGDVRELNHLLDVCETYQPDIVIHMAAQPIVRGSYKDPVGTYSTNVMGTVNICEAVRQTPSVKSFLNVTTDKVYENKEWEWGYRENEPLDGYDPYSNSKSCSELVTHCYKSSFLDGRTAVSTARAGNVIGGGDFAKDRIIPDCIRAAINGDDIIVRNPFSTRPYQHVLEPVFAYLMIAAKQYEDLRYQSWYNVGPDDRDCFQTGALVELFVKHWGEGIKWVSKYDGGPHEANFLKLDCSKLKATFGWRPHWDLETAVEKTVEWSKVWIAGEDVRAVMDKQIKEFMEVE
jgi:CDP-glucose 4,6-dehydratase